MHRDLKQLEEEGGWKNDPAFAEYQEVVNKFPDACDGFRDEIKDGGKAFFRRAEEVFFENYRSQFNKHIASCVRKSDTAATNKGAPNTARLLPCMMGGHPELAREYAAWLLAAEDRGEVDVGDDDEWFRHHFSTKEIVLDHNEGDLPPIKIKIDDCMEYLTGEVNPFEMLKIPLVQDNMEFLRRMAAIPRDLAAVDIFDDQTWPVGQDGSKHDFILFLIMSTKGLLHIVVTDKGWRIMFKMLDLSAKQASEKGEDPTVQRHILILYATSICNQN